MVQEFEEREHKVATLQEEVRIAESLVRLYTGGLVPRPHTQAEWVGLLRQEVHNMLVINVYY